MSTGVTSFGKTRCLSASHLTSLLKYQDTFLALQIANLVTRQGDTKPIVRNVMTLKSCSPIVGADVMAFEDEADLLSCWAKLIRDVDPDVIIGYNIANFDLPYLIERSRVKGLDSVFQFLGRVKGVKMKMKDTTFSSK